METIKFLVFIEILMLVICLACDIVAYFVKIHFSRSIYWISSIIVIGAILLSEFVAYPIFEWWMR